MNPLSYTTVRIEMYCGDTSAGPGTGFLYRDGSGLLWLATAAHNLTLRNPRTEMWLTDSCSLPSRIGFRVLRESTISGTRSVQLRSSQASVELYESSNGRRRATWAHHPSGLGTDVAAIPLRVETLGNHLAVNDQAKALADFSVDAGRDIDILGYPKGLDAGADLPLWKRGAIASEPDFVGSEFMVDSATREGMSGAPVFARKIGMFPDGPKHVIAGERRKFIGIYVGRNLHSNNEAAAQIGRVVKAQCLTEVLADPRFFEPAD